MLYSKLLLIILSALFLLTGCATDPVDNPRLEATVASSSATAPGPQATATGTPTSKPTPGRSRDAATKQPTGTDPDLKAGFPIGLGFDLGPTYKTSTLIGNLDADPQLEVLVSQKVPNVAARDVWAYNVDGSVVKGWPVRGAHWVHAALGRLTSSPDIFSPVLPALTGLEVVERRGQSTAVFTYSLAAYSASAAPLPGWPVGSQPGDGNSTPYGNPGLADLDADGRDEVIIRGGAGIEIYGVDGKSLLSSPIPADNFALGDLNSDKRAEIVGDGVSALVAAFGADGRPLPGFVPPARPTPLSSVGNYPVIGDVDGDGVPEIVVVFSVPPGPDVDATVGFPFRIFVISNTGAIKREITFVAMGQVSGFNLVLGDLDCDGGAEIILQTAYALHAWKGDGSAMPGWPQVITSPKDGLSGGMFGSSPPVVGDIDGDFSPEVVTIVARGGGYSDTDLRAYSHDGQMLPRFPKLLYLGVTASPAIADIDADGRNEIVVASAHMHTFDQPTPPDSIWAFDLKSASPYGNVQWGQYMGGPQHAGYYDARVQGCKR